jgi:hypothetical protein
MITLIELAFFLGCEVERNGKRGYTLTGINTGDDSLNPVGIVSKDGFPYWVKPESIKPALRPFSDMTEEEAGRKVDAQITAYLTGRHFDVFDWIGQGLAIDATKKEVEP